MANYEELPLFPLHVVLYPDMPLPLHIFEPRYRHMVQHCMAEDSVFGVVLIESGEETALASPSTVGTTARITQFEELPTGKINIVVVGETRFRIVETRTDHPYLTARAEPFWERATDPRLLQTPFDTAIRLFKTYLKNLLALTNRPLSALQLPHEPEYLSYAIASVLQIPLEEKQRLLEITATDTRLQREIAILSREIEAQRLLRKAGQADGAGGSYVPANMEELGKLASLN